ncbi:uncharacterized protein LOC112463112 [Temnothorax curvispinosus]|uniref:Uncharacterized protein LOC112463112 n=1 Tax=Temnothorax curvispinosus TaxID=300111 RepID=A0A6J1QRG2_9HYME|nr:uncharacterized protein LOC112463112 [Temnothorax curvispinosus]
MFPPKGKFYTKKKDMFGNIEKMDVRKEWERVLKIAKPELITKKWAVCSLHFDRSDYVLPDVPAKRRVLQKTAIPKYNLPQRQQSEEEKVVEEKKKKNEKNRETRRINREKLKESKDHVQDLYKLVMDHQAQQSEDLEDIQCNEEGEPNLSSPFVDAGTQTDSGVSGCEPTFVNKDVQIGSINVCHLIKNDKDLSIMTGIENFGILNAIVDILNTVSSIQLKSHLMITNQK